MHGKCPDVERVEKRITSMSTRIDTILIGIVSILATILGSLVV